MLKWLSKLFKKQRPAPPTLCVIDDDRFIHYMIREYFGKDYDVTCMYSLPSTAEEEDALKSYDVLIVDGQGIGSSRYKDGQQFLSKYYDRPMTQKVIYFSGLEPDPLFETILKEKGMRWHTKGRDPMSLVNLVQYYTVAHPKVDGARTMKNMKELHRRRRGRRGFITSEGIVVALVVVIILGIIFHGCNRDIIDVNWNFQKAVIRDGFGNMTGAIKIKSWRDYDTSDMVQIVTEKGEVILTHSTNVLLIHEGGK